MAQTNILLEAGTNELEVVEFYLDEAVPDQTDVAADRPADAPPPPDRYRGYYGVNVAKVLEIIRMPKVTELPEVQHPSVLGAFNLRSRIIPLVDLAMWLAKPIRLGRSAQDHCDGIQQRHHSVYGFGVNRSTASAGSGWNRPTNMWLPCPTIRSSAWLSWRTASSSCWIWKKWWQT